MRDIDLVKELQTTGKMFFTLADLEKVTGLGRKSIYVALNRWLKRGVLERAGRGVYVVPGSGVQLEAVAGQLYFPCYLSFESALNRAGVLNVVSYSLTFATTRKTKRLSLLGRTVDYRQIKKELFFGFEAVDRFYIAEAEKALLDLIYLSALGKVSLPLDEMDLRSLSKQALRDYAERFPPRVAKKLDEILPG